MVIDSMALSGSPLECWVIRYTMALPCGVPNRVVKVLFGRVNSYPGQSATNWSVGALTALSMISRVCSVTM